MFSDTENQLQNYSTHSETVNSTTLKISGSVFTSSPLLRIVLGLFVAMAAVSIGICVF